MVILIGFEGVDWSDDSVAQLFNANPSVKHNGASLLLGPATPASQTRRGAASRAITRRRRVHAACRRRESLRDHNVYSF